MKHLNVCKVKDGYLATLTQTFHLGSETDVNALIRYEGLKHDTTAMNEVSFSPKSE